MFDKVLEAFKQTVNYVHVYFIKRYVDDYIRIYIYIYMYMIKLDGHQKCTELTGTGLKFVFSLTDNGLNKCHLHENSLTLECAVAVMS